MSAQDGVIVRPPVVAFRPAGPSVVPLGPERPPRRRRTRRWVAAGLVAALVLVAGLATVVFWPGRGPWVSADDLAALGVTEVVEDVPLTGSVPVEVDFDPGTVDASDAVAVYLDADLRVPAPDAEVRAVSDGYEIRPQQTVAWAGVSAASIGATAGEWGFADHYFVALRVDPATAAPLAQPRVSAFTVRTAAPSPQVDYTVDEQGVGRATWAAVDGATSYRVLRLDQGRVSVQTRDAGQGWATTDRPTATLGAYGEQNTALSTVTYSADALRAEEFVDRNPITESHYLVQAVTADDRSSGVRTLPADLATDLPVSLATHALTELGIDLDGPIAPDQLPDRIPVTMADGRTLLHPVSYQPEPTSSPGGWEVRLGVERTLFRLTVTVAADDAEVVRQAITAAQDRAAADPTTAEYVYQVPAAVDLSAVEVSSTAPAVELPVHGSTELVRYLSAQLIAGEEYIDLEAHLTGARMSTADGVDLWDAFYEAVYQTPMALAYARVDAVYLPDHHLLVLTYADPAEQRAADQAALAEAVRTATAQIITPGMSDADKVRAINQHLLDIASYDDAAYDAQLDGRAADFPQAWLPTGVLLYGTGVCVSYASAFQALADAAGLDSVMVTGVAVDGGEGHAWNKVWVDGAWRVVDSTWNDSPWVRADRFLLQTDAQAFADRTEDQEWVVDANQGLYAAG